MTDDHEQHPPKMAKARYPAKPPSWPLGWLLHNRESLCLYVIYFDDPHNASFVKLRHKPLLMRTNW